MSGTLPPFVSWTEVDELRETDPRTVLVDTRWYWDRPGRAAWAAAHVPGAVHLDLATDLSGPMTATSGRQPLPSPGLFAAAMSRAGIDGEHPVLAYDDAGGVIAARLVWMLRCLGVPAAVISGGTTAYGGTLCVGDQGPGAPVAFTPRPWPDDVTVSTEEVARAVAADDLSMVLVDARPPNRYQGEAPEVDPRLGVVPQADPRAGHIPTAINLPCRGNLDVGGQILPPERLRATFVGVGIGTQNAARVVSYCGSGVTACHNLLALEHAGLGRARLYPGSWSAWSRQPELPVATGTTSG